MQSQVVQTTGRQTAVMDIAQTMDLVWQNNGLIVYLRKQVLQLRRVRVKIPQVGADIRIGYVRQTEQTDVAF